MILKDFKARLLGYRTVLVTLQHPKRPAAGVSMAHGQREIM